MARPSLLLCPLGCVESTHLLNILAHLGHPFHLTVMWKQLCLTSCLT